MTIFICFSGAYAAWTCIRTAAVRLQLDLVLSKRRPEFGLDVRENFLVADRSDNGVAVDKVSG